MKKLLDRFRLPGPAQELRSTNSGNITRGGRDIVRTTSGNSRGQRISLAEDDYEDDPAVQHLEAAQDEFLVSLAASLSKSESDAQLQQRLHRTAQQSTHNGSSRGSTSRTYWETGVLGYEHRIDCPDAPFYDCWGDFPEATDNLGEFPALADLIETRPPPEDIREVLVVDIDRDPKLLGLLAGAADACLKVKTTASLEKERHRAQAIAIFVAQRMGGEAKNQEQLKKLEKAWHENSEQAKQAHDSVTIPIGALNYGLHRHRALIYKVLADTQGISCMVLRGRKFHKKDELVQAVIRFGQNEEYVVNLVDSPGTLMPFPSRSGRRSRGASHHDDPPRHSLSDSAVLGGPAASAAGRLSSDRPPAASGGTTQPSPHVGDPVPNSDPCGGSPGSVREAPPVGWPWLAAVQHSQPAGAYPQVAPSATITSHADIFGMTPHTPQVPGATPHYPAVLPSDEPHLPSTSSYGSLASVISLGFSSTHLTPIAATSIVSPPTSTHSLPSMPDYAAAAAAAVSAASAVNVAPVPPRPDGPAAAAPGMAMQSPFVFAVPGLHPMVYSAPAPGDTGSSGQGHRATVPPSLGVHVPLAAPAPGAGTPGGSVGSAASPFASMQWLEAGLSGGGSSHIPSIPSPSPRSKASPFAAMGHELFKDPFVSSVSAAPPRPAPVEEPPATALEVSTSAPGPGRPLDRLQQPDVSISAPTSFAATPFVAVVAAAAGSGAPPQDAIASSSNVVASSTSYMAGESVGLQLDTQRWEIDPNELQLGARVGIGSYGEVYRGSWNGTDVAIKRFLEQNLSEQTLQEFRSEVSLMSRLAHPNIVQFLGAVTQPQQLAIVTQFVPRGSLFRLLHRSRPEIDDRRRLSMAMDIAKGMNYLHTRVHLVHRDLKSPNLLVERDWTIKVCDFGLSRVKSATFLTSKSHGGTPEWMAPEILRNDKSDEKSDVYSYGVVLYELVTGMEPWSNLNAMQVVGAVGFAGQRLELPADVAPRTADLITRCWSTEPHLRPSFAEVLEELKTFTVLGSSPVALANINTNRQQE